MVHSFTFRLILLLSENTAETHMCFLYNQWKGKFLSLNFLSNLRNLSVEKYISFY